MDTAAAISLEEATIATAIAPITKRDITKWVCAQPCICERLLSSSDVFSFCSHLSFRAIIRVTILVSTRATITKTITTTVTQIMGKVTITIEDLENHITSRTTISSINRWVTRNVLWLKTTFVLITVLKASHLLFLVTFYKIGIYPSTIFTWG